MRFHRVPVVAAALTMIAGFFVLVGGIAFVLFGVVFAALFGFLPHFFLIGVLLGLLMMAMAVLLVTVPRFKAAWGVVTIVLSVLSLVFAFGGLVIGFIVGVVGGVLAILQPSRVPPAVLGPF